MGVEQAFDDYQKIVNADKKHVDLARERRDIFKKAFKAEPGTYSIEGYDAAVVLLQGIDQGNTTRADLLDFVETYNGQGFSKTYKWTDEGELSETPVFGYKVDNGKIVSVGALD